MDISPNALRKELVSTLNEVNQQLEITFTGNANRTTLLLAKAECLNALVTLQAKKP